MAKKRKTPAPDADGYLRTGIYERTTPQVPAIRYDPAVLQNLQRLLDRSLDDELTAIHNLLKPIVEPFLERAESPKCDTLTSPGNCEVLDIGDGPCLYRQLPDIEQVSVEANQARDAIEALRELREIKHCLGDDKALFRCSLYLGTLLERISVRPFEHSAKVGGEYIARANEMRPEKRSRKELQREATKALEQAKRDYPDRGLTTQKERAAESLGIRRSAFYDRLK